jgi:hypothetical protein
LSSRTGGACSVGRLLAPVSVGSPSSAVCGRTPGLQGPRCAPASPVPDGTGLRWPSPAARVPAGLEGGRLALPVEHQPNRGGAALCLTAATPATGEPRILATYESDDGTRQLVGQRINGRVALSDVPAGDAGKVYLVERHLPSTAELDGLVADYLALAAELGRPPLRSDWILDA